MKNILFYVKYYFIIFQDGPKSKNGSGVEMSGDDVSFINI